MLAEPKPALVQVPARAGVGLRFRPRYPDPCWPATWWQRNYDTLCEDVDLDPCPYTERMMRVPPAPASRSGATGTVLAGGPGASATPSEARTELPRAPDVAS